MTSSLECAQKINSTVDLMHAVKKNNNNILLKITKTDLRYFSVFICV